MSTQHHSPNEESKQSNPIWIILYRIVLACAILYSIFLVFNIFNQKEAPPLIEETPQSEATNPPVEEEKEDGTKEEVANSSEDEIKEEQDISSLWGDQRSISPERSDFLRWLLDNSLKNNAARELYYWSKEKSIPPHNVFPEEIDFLLSEAKKSNAEAEYHLAMLQYFDPSQLKDRIALLESSSSKGCVKAKMTLAKHYETQNYNYSKAIELYHEAAKLGDCDALKKLAYYYERGIDVEQNEEKAIKFFIESVAKNDRVATSYKKHIRAISTHLISSDLEKEAVGWYIKGAIIGIPEAQRELAFAYEKGIAIKQDTWTALKWYQKLADKGCTFSMLRIGYFHENGLISPSSELDALNWYRKSKEAGDPDADECISDLLNKRKKYVEKQEMERFLDSGSMRWAA